MGLVRPVFEVDGGCAVDARDRRESLGVPFDPVGGEATTTAPFDGVCVGETAGDALVGLGGTGGGGGLVGT